MPARFTVDGREYRMNASFSTADEGEIGNWHHAASDDGSTCQVCIRNNRPVEVKMVEIVTNGNLPEMPRPAKPSEPSGWLLKVGDRVEAVRNILDTEVGIPFGGVAVKQRTGGTIISWLPEDKVIVSFYSDGGFVPFEVSEKALRPAN